MADLLVPVGGAFAGRYVIEGELGHGATAAVYLARDLKHGRHVALKVLRPDLAASLESARFLREIRLLARLQHPHILPLFDSGEHEGALFYVMPRVEGETLGQRLRREQQISVGEALRITREVADALAYAHAHDVVHRDIKPDNILLDGTHALVADFGIARAVHRAVDSGGGDRITSAGLAIGTPAYMSPEQASGEREVEGRSDIYSLACVLYEMLAGRYPFQGPSLQSMIARRFAGPPPPVSTLREGIPREVDAALTRALQPAPDARFQTVREFCEALPPPTAETASVHARRARRWPYAVAAVVLVIAVLLGVQQCRQPPVDADLYVVLPFEHPRGAGGELSGEQCELFLSDALARWDDVRLVDAPRVKDARARHGGSPLSLSSALDMAAGLGAGRLVWGSVSEMRDTIYVRATLYDVASGGSVRQHIVRIPSDLGEAFQRFAELADRLLVGDASTPAPGGTRSLAAWRAYDRAHAALDVWDLDSAVGEFGHASALDPGFAEAHLWHATTMMWGGSDPSDEWRTAAERAYALRERLGARDRLSAAAVASLAAGSFVEACERYEELIARDSLDFTAWFGLGECHRRDRLVLRDERSPSGWRFQASYRSAIEAYRRALQIVPSMHLAFRGPMLSRLSGLLVTETNVVRRGYALDPDTVAFLAFPSLLHDTLAFVPFRAEDVAAARPGTRSETITAAVAGNQNVLLEITRAWVRSFPESADAHEALATALESTGRAGNDGALPEVLRAMALTSEPAQSLRLAVAEIRLLVKSGDFGRAQVRADSLLSAHAVSRDEVALQLRGVAALLGRVETTARLARQSAALHHFLGPDWRSLDIPAELSQAGAAFLAYASHGAPRDSLLVLERRIDDLVRSYVASESRQRVRDALTLVPSALAFAEIGPRSVHRMGDLPYPLLRMQAALARGDTSAMLDRFADLRAYRAPVRPGDVAIDGTFQEAWLLLAAGDTAVAEEHLDLTLNALPTLGTHLLDEMPQAAALPRAMALRAEVAARRGDAALARHWARAVVALWSNADPALDPLTRRMHVLAGPAAP